MAASKAKMREKKMRNQPVSVQYPASSTQNGDRPSTGTTHPQFKTELNLEMRLNMRQCGDSVRRSSAVFDTFWFSLLCLWIIGKGSDAGPSEKHPSSGKPKKPHLRGDWVRGHQRDGGIYAKEMPKHITGNNNFSFISQHTYCCK